MATTAQAVMFIVTDATWKAIADSAQILRVGHQTTSDEPATLQTYIIETLEGVAISTWEDIRAVQLKRKR